MQVSIGNIDHGKSWFIGTRRNVCISMMSCGTDGSDNVAVISFESMETKLAKHKKMFCAELAMTGKEEVCKECGHALSSDSILMKPKELLKEYGGKCGTCACDYFFKHAHCFLRKILTLGNKKSTQKKEIKCSGCKNVLDDVEIWEGDKMFHTISLKMTKD